MEKWFGKVAVVTGASSGIGAEVCRRLAEEGLQVVGLARRVGKIEELSQKVINTNGKIYPLKCDVTKLNEVEECFGFITKNIGPIQILINNAGMLTIGSFIDGNPEDWQVVMDTNVQGALSCTHYALNDLKNSQCEGQIININSINGHYLQGGISSFTNIYSPSKHALKCVTELLRQEITKKQLKVKITSLSPGQVKTKMNTDTFEVLKNILKNTVPQPGLEVEDIADTVVYILSTPENVHIRELIISPTGEKF